MSAQSESGAALHEALMTTSSLTKDPQPREALTLESALALFHKIADHGGIAFSQARDGCHHRAEMMCDELFKLGHSPHKAWAFESETKELLSAELPGGGRAEWWFHVAPALPVAMPDGRIEPLIFDPALFDSPVTLSEWGQLLSAKPSRLQVVPYGQPADGYEGDFCPNTKTTPTSAMEAWMQQSDQLMWDEFGKRTVFQGRLYRNLLADGHLPAVPDAGRKWQSVPRVTDAVTAEATASTTKPTTTGLKR